ncbi:MAG: YdcF family protein [Gemmatimonadaceae bacterium]|nr:YdcF family protein [Gemmatimonadaceae bacterium]
MAGKAKGTSGGAGRAGEAVAGAVLGGVAWLLAVEVGVVQLAKVGEMSGFFPAMACGALLGVFGLAKLLWVVNVLQLVVIGVVIATPAPARHFVRRFVRETPVPATGVEAVVVLSANLSADGLLSGEAVDRLLTGLVLAKKVGAPVFITTRVHSPDDEAVTSDADQSRLITLAATGARWLVVPRVRDTREEAKGTAVLAAREGFRRVAVVTSPMHTSRSCALFEREQLTVTCVPAQERTTALRSLKSPRDRIRAFRLGLYETVAWGWYRLRGWL